MTATDKDNTQVRHGDETLGLEASPSSDSGRDTVVDDKELFGDGPTTTFAQQTVSLSDEKVEEEERAYLDKSTEYPDGGLRAWLVVFGSFMGLFPVWGMYNTLGAIEGYVSEHQLAGNSTLEISWIFSLHLTIGCICCVFSGSYFDRNGGQKAIIVGGALYVFGIFMMSECTKVWQFILAFSVSSGIGAGIATTPLVSCVATWFNKRRAVATSLATCGSSIGGIIMPLILRRMYVTIGYKWAIKVLSLIFLVNMSLAALLARERVTPKVEPFKSFKEGATFYAKTSLNWRYFLDSRFLWCSIAFALGENSICVTATYISSYINKQGLPASMPYTALTVMNATALLGRYIPSYFADHHFGRFNVQIVMALLAAVLHLTMWLPFGSNLRVLWAWVCIYGFMSGSVFSLSPVCISQICKTSDFGKYYSTAYLLNALVTLPIMPIAGAVIGNGSIQGYNNFIIFTAMLILCAGFCYAISRTYCVGWRLCRF
ncbi:AaceriADL155Cp [[Ashbya] aceris (nom. inval.)]|nr:AaceriADL155Cp [[Ashbya] aceris (nom. inval.)]